MTGSRTICAGVDAGSRAIKIVLLDRTAGKIVAQGLADQGVRQEALARELLDRLLAGAGLRAGDIARTVATGYGRERLAWADTTVTEITCHAAGVRYGRSDAMTIIEIGGQDSKLIRLGPDGAVRDFAMNDRCAAGTGTFLELVARRLDVPLAALDELARRGAAPAPISSTCAVFAETEIVGLLASGASREDIAAGVEASIAARISAMAGRKLDEPVVFTGGVAMLPGMRERLASALRRPVSAADNPRMTGALGAALLACRQCASESNA